jgi:hypothetical protein
MAVEDRDDDRYDRHDGDKKKYVSKMPNRKYGFFRDDQITFLVTHPADQIDQTQLRDFATAMNGALEPLDGGGVRNLPQAISFPSLTDQETEQCKALLSSEEVDTAKKAFSLVTCDLEGAPDDPAQLLEIVENLNKQLSPDPQAPGDSKASIAGLTIHGASLNWLTSVAAQGSGTGGPGGKPSPYYGSRKNAPYCFDIKKQLEGASGGSIYGDGFGVDVAILDTTPSGQALVSAYKEWPDHPLISTLLGPNGKLHLYPATYNELLRMTCTSLNEHDYQMTDHGLFIAGIIHSIVPKAEIHLIEVLNQYGVGDLTSFTQGLLTVYEKIKKPDRKLVINCSWMLEFPLDDRHCRHMNQIDDLDAEFERAVRDFSIKDQATTERVLELLFSRFYGLGRQAIAAAGNDGQAGYAERTRARYPAALKRVTGVGALPKSLPRTGDQRNNYVPSDFSNLSESADSRGVVTKGVVTLGGEEGEGKGVLGLYIGEFPGCCRNESKWAWWAGTSFATPILTATVASVLSRKENEVTTTQGAIDKLYNEGAKIILDGQASKQEDALPVTQS